MLAHLLDHFVFSSRRLAVRTKQIVFGVCVFIIVGSFWWFKGVAWGIDGPINEHWGLKWRSVRPCLSLFMQVADALRVGRIGISITSNYYIRVFNSSLSLALSSSLFAMPDFRIYVFSALPSVLAWCMLSRRSNLVLTSIIIKAKLPYSHGREGKTCHGGDALSTHASHAHGARNPKDEW